MKSHRRNLLESEEPNENQRHGGKQRLARLFQSSVHTYFGKKVSLRNRFPMSRWRFALSGRAGSAELLGVVRRFFTMWFCFELCTS